MPITAEFRDNPRSSAAAFGRIFYGLDNRIMFSQVLVDDINTLGKCYQKNDPTSSELSDILATDGGDIQLQNAGRIFKIEEFLNGVVAFADNGVFYVYGPQAGFNATDYSVQKVTEFTLFSPRGSQRVGDAIFYVSESGIFVLQPNQFGELKAENITEASINTYFEEFLVTDIITGYNPSDKQIHFISPSTKKGLIYDLRVNAWYPQQYSGTNHTVDSIVRERSNLYFLNNDSVNDVHNFATLTDRTFNDFGESYDSFILSQPETLGGFSTKQTAVNLKIVMEKTETEITSVDGSGEYVFDYPSACLFKALWDFETEASPKTTKRTVNLYRLNKKRIVPTSFPWTYDTGETTVENRINIRGTGKAVQYKFSSEPNKDLRIFGYAVEYGSNTRQ